MNKPKFFYGWYIVAASWTMTFVSSAAAVSIFLKPMLEDFGWDRATLSSVQSVAMVVLTIALPFLGRLIDRFGPRAMILASVPVQVLSRLLTGVATNIWHLYLGRTLFYLRVFNSTQVLINRWFVKKRGTMLAIVATGMPAGMMILAPISQQLILIWGWRPTMLFWAAVTLVIVLPLALIIRNNPEDKGCGPDGEPLHKVRSIDPSPQQADAVSKAEFGIETGSNLSGAMKNKAFWLLGAERLICGFGCGFVWTHIVIFATDAGYSDMIAAGLVSVQGASNLVGLLVMGYLSDRIVRSKVLALTHFIRSMSFAAIAIFIVMGYAPLWMLYAAIASLGFGATTTGPLSAGLTADLFGNLRMGTILGVMLSGHMLGAALGSYAGGAIFELTGDYYLFFLIQGPLEFLAAASVFFIAYLKAGSARGN